jgi:MFS family permease
VSHSLHTFDSLRLHRNYRLYFSGQAISQIGTWLQGAAQSWLVLELTHSAVDVGLVSFWQFVPFTLFGLFGGALSDRLDPRRTLIATQAAMGLLAVALAAFAWLHSTNMAVVYAIAAARGVVMIFNSPSLQRLMIRLVGREELANAISLNSGVNNATRIVGPGLAGVIIATAGVGICFALNAVSYVAVVIALAVMNADEFFPVRQADLRMRMLTSVREGLSYARKTNAVLIPLLLLTVVSITGINFSVLLPVLAAQTLHSGPEVFGLISSLFGLGAVLGALIAAALSRATWSMLLLSAAGYSLFQVLLAPQRELWLVLVFLVVVGIFYTVYTSATNAMVQLAAPDDLQGRVAGLYSYVFLGTSPLGALFAGYLSEAGGTNLAFLAAGVIGLLVTAASLLGVRRSVRAT